MSRLSCREKKKKHASISFRPRCAQMLLATWRNSWMEDRSRNFRVIKRKSKPFFFGPNLFFSWNSIRNTFPPSTSTRIPRIVFRIFSTNAIDRNFLILVACCIKKKEGGRESREDSFLSSSLSLSLCLSKKSVKSQVKRRRKKRDRPSQPWNSAVETPANRSLGSNDRARPWFMPSAGGKTTGEGEGR